MCSLADYAGLIVLTDLINVSTMCEISLLKMTCKAEAVPWDVQLGESTL